jgi:putative chitinase
VQTDSSLALTIEQFKQATSASQFNAEKYYPFVKGACKAFGITTKLRLAAFLSQIGHESASLSRIEENLNYSAHGLMQTWPGRFPTMQSAQPYDRNPQKIANKVYANRMSNGDVESGDGWKFRGRGLKQLTGKSNYQLLTKAFGVDFVSEPELLLHPVWASLSACWFWETNGCHSFADKGDIIGLTKRINGGLIGIEDRQIRFKQALDALKDYSYNP